MRSTSWQPTRYFRSAVSLWMYPRHRARPHRMPSCSWPRLVRVLQQRTGIRLWLVTHGAGAWLRALVRVLAIEHPGLHASLVDLTGADTDSLVASDGASDHRPVLAVDGLEALL